MSSIGRYQVSLRRVMGWALVVSILCSMATYSLKATLFAATSVILLGSVAFVRPRGPCPRGRRNSSLFGAAMFGVASCVPVPGFRGALAGVSLEVMSARDLPRAFHRLRFCLPWTLIRLVFCIAMDVFFVLWPAVVFFLAWNSRDLALSPLRAVVPCVAGVQGSTHGGGDNCWVIVVSTFGWLLAMSVGWQPGARELRHGTAKVLSALFTAVVAGCNVGALVSLLPLFYPGTQWVSLVRPPCDDQEGLLLAVYAVMSVVLYAATVALSVYACHRVLGPSNRPKPSRSPVLGVDSRWSDDG